ncbi:MAG TPA: hypothetical protein VJT31_05985, partial [Rugosimonospora sp.]|nr:hypothetical protein [Rugosimonospora sp.]
MDFWDLTKLLVRRWMIGLPMLLLSCGLAALTLFAVKPDYTTTAHIQLVPPVTGATQPGQSTIDQRNPWIGLGLQALGNAAIVTVTDQSVLDQMHANGYSDSYTATMAESSPLISFEIVATSPDQARATTEELASRFTRSIVDQQSASGVAPKDMIIARRLDMATTVVKSSSKVKRAVVGVAGAGFLLTAGVTVGADAWLNRRRRRK